MEITKENQNITISFKGLSKFLLGKQITFPISSIVKIETTRPSLPFHFNLFTGSMSFGQQRSHGPVLRKWKVQQEFWYVDHTSALEKNKCVTITLKDQKYKLIVLDNSNPSFWSSLKSELDSSGSNLV